MVGDNQTWETIKEVVFKSMKLTIVFLSQPVLSKPMSKEFNNPKTSK